MLRDKSLADEAKKARKALNRKKAGAKGAGEPIYECDDELGEAKLKKKAPKEGTWDPKNPRATDRRPECRELRRLQGRRPQGGRDRVLHERGRDAEEQALVVRVRPRTERALGEHPGHATSAPEYAQAGLCDLVDEQAVRAFYGALFAVGV